MNVILVKNNAFRNRNSQKKNRNSLDNKYI